MTSTSKLPSKDRFLHVRTLEDRSALLINAHVPAIAHVSHEVANAVLAWKSGDDGLLETLSAADRNGVVELLTLDPKVGSADEARINSYRLVLTERCNLRCSYCFLTQYKERMDSATLDIVLEKILRTSRGYPIEELQFFGGEPMMAYALIEQAVRRLEAAKDSFQIPSIRYSLTTNGTVLPQGAIELLSTHNFTVDISVDGPQPLHDQARGAGTYAKAIATYCKLRLLGVDVGLIVTPTRLNFRALPEYCDQVIKELGVRSITINTPQPSVGGWDLPGAEFAEVVLQCIQLGSQTGVSFTTPADRLINAYRALRLVPNACTRYSGNYGVLVDTEGRFRICDVDWTVDEFIISDEHLENPRLLDTIKLTSSNAPSKCQRCIAFAGCGGPCPLERKLNPFDHVTNLNRCSFNETVVDAVIQSDYGAAFSSNVAVKC